MIAQNMKEILESPSAGAIRKMFEEGVVLKKKYGEENVFDFSIGNPDLEPPLKLQEAVRIVASDTSHMRHGYMQNSGYKECREAMAKKTSIEQETDVSWNNIVMSVGAAGAINCVLKAILNPDDEVIVPSPYFPEYEHYIKNHGGKIRIVPTKDDFSLDIDAIKNALSFSTAAVLINSPNNPTGKIYGEEEIYLLSAALDEFGKKSGRFPLLICDEPYRAITYGKAKVSSVFKLYENSVVVTSFAKNFSVPGERIGYIAVNPSCREGESLVSALNLATRILGFVNAPAFFQKVIEKSWDAECDYSLYERRRNKIMAIMDEAGFSYAKPDGAFYLFVKIPDKWNEDDILFTEHLKKFNILCAPGSSFGKKGWFRLSYCVPEKTILASKNAFLKAASL